MPRRTSPSPSSRASGFLARGMLAWNPAVIAGVTIMKMISSTNITSIIGVTLIFAATAPSVFFPPPIAIGRYPLIGPLVCDVFWVWNSFKDRTAELAADTLDEIVDQL